MEEQLRDLLKAIEDQNVLLAALLERVDLMAETLNKLANGEE